MADYGLKYRAEFKNTRGHEYQLDIYQRDFSGTTKTIKTLCGCVLEIQGAQGDVTAPIVKTQLRFSLVDAWDIADTTNAKWGNWSEFYTPDATLYKVQLRSMSGSSTSPIWTGYITPDSWQEDLGYRTAITITARDNIGHLQDFPFEATGDVTPDENGLIQIRYIFSKAMSVIDFPMTLAVESYGTGQYSADVPCTEDGDFLTEAAVNAGLFDGMNWYDVLEQTLEAIGYTYRYVGGNKCVIGCLRNLPKMGHYTSATPSQTLEFYGGSLEFDPAVKQIEEKVDFKMQKDVPLEILSGIQFGNSTTYRCKVEGNTLPGGGTVSIPEHDAPADTVSGSGNTAWVSGYDMFDPSGRLPDDYLVREEGADGWKLYPMIPSNYVSDAYIRSRFQFHTKTAAIKIAVNFTPHPLSIRNSGSMSGKMMAPHYSLSEIKYQVRYLNDSQSVVRYWNGAGWTTNVNDILTRQYDAQNEYGNVLEIELAECEDIDSGTIVVCFLNIKYKMWSDGGHGVYARVQSILVSLLSTRAVNDDKVTTINNDDYNVKVERKPLFGAMSREVGYVRPANYLAALFYYPYYGSYPEQLPYQVRFTDRNATVPLPVLIHQQILCYRHGAARVLNGRCAPINKAKFDLSGLFTYKGTTYLLQGGTLDLFSGIMEGAVLHEFVDFNELWTGTPSYSESTDYNTDTPGTGHSGGNAGGAVPGGGGSSVSISDVATSGGKIVKITINGVDTEIKNKVEWGSSGSNKAELYVNNEPKTVLTDGWTELPSVTSSDNGKVLKVVSGHWTKGTVSGGGSVNEKCAPRVMLRRQAQVQGQHAWFFDVSHPVLQNVSGAEAVLMVYSRKRSRYSQGGTDKTRGSNSRGWAAALGKDAGAAFTMIGRDVLDLKTYLIQNYMCAVGQASLDTMTLSQFQNGASTAYRAFGHVSYSNGATFLAKTRRSRVFGIAVRYENPDFTAAVSGTVSDHTTMVNVGGNAVGRWIYTDVEKIRAVCQYNTDTSKWEIGFNIIE